MCLSTICDRHATVTIRGDAAGYVPDMRSIRILLAALLAALFGALFAFGLFAPVVAFA